MSEPPVLKRFRHVDLPAGRRVLVDLHGYRPRDVAGAPLAAIVAQAWETGADAIRFIHGHGRSRGKSPGFYNTRTGYFGLSIRRQLRHNRALRQWIKYSTLECDHWGTTTVRLKANPNPTRVEIDPGVLPKGSYAGGNVEPAGRGAS